MKKYIVERGFYTNRDFSYACSHDDLETAWKHACILVKHLKFSETRVRDGDNVIRTVVKIPNTDIIAYSHECADKFTITYSVKSHYYSWNDWTGFSCDSVKFHKSFDDFGDALKFRDTLKAKIIEGETIEIYKVYDEHLSYVMYDQSMYRQ